jgi:uncharacterized protein (TIGR02186 family)
MRLLALLPLLLLAALPLQAEEDIVLGLSQAEVSISTNFDGSEILIFGAVKRETAIPDGPPLQVVATISGPSRGVTVRRKERRFGIWVNTDAVLIDRAPSFYAVATSAPLYEALSRVEDLRHSITIPRAIRSVGAPMNIQDSASFTDALIRIKTRVDQYQLLEEAIRIDEQTLFRAAIHLPAALTEGDYDTRIFLTRGGQVVAKYETIIDVRKVGLERVLFNMSRQQSFLYGLLSLFIAVLAGWGASAIFGLLRR